MLKKPDWQEVYNIYNRLVIFGVMLFYKKILII